MRILLSLAAVSLAAVSLLACPDAAQAADAPKPLNVLMIAVDDLRPTFGAYGHPEIKTPNLDALAAGGFLFQRAYTMQAVCSPSRTCLLTGRRPDTTKVYDLQTHFRKFLPDIVTLPQAFKNAGYHTQSFGKVYHGSLDDPASWSVKTKDPGQGHATKKPAATAAKNVTGKVLERDPKTGLALKIAPNAKTGRGPSWEARDVNDDDLGDGQIAAAACAALNDIKDKPFFLAVGFYKPHLPFIAPKKYFDLYPPETIKLPANPYPPKDAPEFALTSGGELRTYAGVPETGPIGEAQTRELIRAYYAAASYTDAQIGRVLNELKRLGLEQNTIVCMWGDHGWKLGEHGSWCKHTNFEIDTNAPLIFRVPGHAKAGTKVHALAEFVDVYPTLSELAGLPQPDGVEGVSLAPVMNDPQRPWKTAAFSQYPRGKVMGYSMRTDRYRYTEWSAAGDEPLARELYDHQVDPQENVNVAGAAENAKLVAELSAQLRAGWKQALPKP